MIVLILIRMIPTKIVMTVILAIIGVMTDNINANIDMDTDPTFLLRYIDYDNNLRSLSLTLISQSKP